MHKKIFLFCVLMVGFFTSLPSVAKDHFTVPILAEELSTVTICEQEFDLPCTVLVGSYDYQADEAVVGFSRRDSATYITYGPQFVIEDQKSFDDFMFYMRKYCFCQMSDEAIDAHGSDGLSNTFLMILNSPGSYVPGETLPSNTLSGLKDCSYFIDVLNCSSEPFDEAWLIKDESPVLSGIDYVYLTNIDNPVDGETVKSCLRAFDDIDGDITDSITVKEDNYTGEELELNQLYTIIYQVSDSALNTAELTIYIKPVDITAPVISGPNTYTSYSSSPLTTADILSQLSVIDNTNEDFTNKITITKDDFTTNKMVPGNYDVIFTVQDASGNKGTKNVVVKVKDNVKPIISGNSEYTKSSKAKLTIGTIISSLSATDDVDGNISNKITVKTDGYTDHQFDSGTYEIVFFVKDNSANESEDFVVTINIEDNGLPIFYVNSRIINIEDSESLTREQIINFLLNTNAIKQNYKSILFVSDNYSENKSEVGLHDVVLKINYNDETSETLSLSINVFEGESVATETDVELPTVEKTNIFKRFFNKLATFFTSFGLKISQFFKKLFNF